MAATAAPVSAAQSGEPTSPELALVSPDLRRGVVADDEVRDIFVREFGSYEPFRPQQFWASAEKQSHRVRRRLVAATAAVVLSGLVVAIVALLALLNRGTGARPVVASSPPAARARPSPPQASSERRPVGEAPADRVRRPAVRPRRPPSSIGPATRSRPHVAQPRRPLAAARPRPKVRETEPGSVLIGPLPDPTPPELRLGPTVARTLLAVSLRYRVDWAALLAAARSRGIRWTDARPAQLRFLARRLRRERAREVLTPPEEVALARYNRAVGLDALVSGLGAARWVLAARVLRDPRIQIYPGGRSDVAAGRVDVRVLALLLYLARAEGKVAVSSLVSGHAPPGDGHEPSAHAFGAAVDIRAVAGKPVFGHQMPGGPVERAIRDMLSLPPEARPLQVISLISLGGPSVALADHDRFLHVGFDPTVAAESPGLELLWRSAGTAYGVPWEVLAAINEIETMNGRFLHVSPAGALGWMQFMPGTWRQYGLDADGNGHADPWNPTDAIFSAAGYLVASGAHSDLRRALWAYNHAQWYVDDVLARARRIENGDSTG